MPAKRKFLPLFLLVSLTALSLYLLSSSPQTPISDFTLHNPQNAISHFTSCSSQIPILTLKVLAYDRLPSLSRCLRSLSAADYASDHVNLHVFIDHFKPLDPSVGPAEVDRKIAESRAILEFVDAFSWKFGEKVVHYRTANAGLQAQWLEAWWPTSDNEFAFVVEDDVEVSPLFYKFLKGLILKYYYDVENFSPMVYGASLQRPRFVAGKHGNKLQVDNGTHLFLYQMVGTWGQLLFPKPWKEFRLWYDEHKTKDIKPILQGMVTTGWYKKMGERIWTPWFIKFIHSRGYYNIYTNLLQERALSVSHRDAGVNYGKTAGPDSYLLDENPHDFNLWEMWPLRNLKWYDFCFREVLPGRIAGSFDELGSVLNSAQKEKTVLLVNLYRTQRTTTWNLLCHFQRLNIQNYIFLGANSDFLVELAERGHPVISASQLIDNIGSSKLKSFRGSNLELIKEILVNAYVIKSCLEYGFDSWVINGNMLPISAAFPETTDHSYDFSSALAADLLFVRSSQAVAKIWVDGFIYKVLSEAKSMMDGDSLDRENMHFGFFAQTALEKEGVRIKMIDEARFGLKIDAHSNETSLGEEKKLVFWSSEMGFDLIQKRLKDMGLWAIDGDDACMAVVCHQS